MRTQKTSGANDQESLLIHVVDLRGTTFAGLLRDDYSGQFAEFVKIRSFNSFIRDDEIAALRGA